MLNLSSTLMKYIISLIVKFWMTSVFWLLMNLRLSIIFLCLHKTVHHSLLIGCMISSVISWSSLNYSIVVIFITFYFVLFYFLLFYLFVCFYHYIYIKFCNIYFFISGCYWIHVDYDLIACTILEPDIWSMLLVMILPSYGNLLKNLRPNFCPKGGNVVEWYSIFIYSIFFGTIFCFLFCK